MAIFDCFSGAAGNMIVGTLLNISLNKQDLEEVVKKLDLSIDFGIKKVKRSGIQANMIDVKEETCEREFREVVRIIESSEIDKGVKKDSIEIFKRLAEAEGRVHGRDYKKAVFHEVGSDDAVFDIVCSVIGIRRLKEKGYRIFTTPITTGRGFAESSHGKIPVPAPAVLEIVKNSKLKLIFSGDGELLTPTAAAILAHFSEGEFLLPMSVHEISYSAGKRNESNSNLLRLILGTSTFRDEIVVIETNVDDMSPEDMAYAVEKLSRTCHDVSVIPVTGKKGRPGWILKAITDFERAEEVAEEIMISTTSIGVRIIPVYHRVKAARKEETVTTRMREKTFNVRLKKSDYTSKPEFEDLKRIAEETGMSLAEIRKIVEERLNEAENRE